MAIPDDGLDIGTWGKDVSWMPSVSGFCNWKDDDVMYRDRQHWNKTR